MMIALQDVPVGSLQVERLPIPGTVFAGHLVEDVVGCGGMGVVFKARHRRLDRLVALKVIAPELLGNAGIRRRFLYEAVTAASLEHPNVVPVHDAGEAHGIAYIVMRYVDGRDLGALVRDVGPLPPARAAEIVARIGDALDAMHRAGFVHRDVKPPNVLIARSGHVYLSDFGLAREVASGTGVTRAGQWVGSVDFVAPEQARGGRADAKSDIYGLGGVLHFALTGRPPYERETDEAKLRAHLCERPPSPSSLQADVPRSVDAVVARALAKEPAQRYSSAAELGRSALVAAGGTETLGSERSVTRAASCPERGMRDVNRDEARTVSAPNAAPTCESRWPRRRPAEPVRSWTRW